jgi:hypothetical protein
MEEQYPIQNQQVPVSSDELYANAINEEKIRNVISQLDPENQLKDIEMRIRGYKKNAFSQEWEKIDPDAPEPPRLLISRFISYLSSTMNQNATQGNLSEPQINALMALAITYLADELDGNAEIYNLENNYTERTRIGHIILNSMFFTLCRALNGQEAKRMWKALSLVENMNQSTPKSKLKEALQFWK